MKRAKPMVVQAFDIVVTVEEFLLRQTCRRSYADSDAGRIGGADLESPNLLCTRPDVYIESWGYARRR